MTSVAQGTYWNNSISNQELNWDIIKTQWFFKFFQDKLSNVRRAKIYKLKKVLTYPTHHKLKAFSNYKLYSISKSSHLWIVSHGKIISKIAVIWYYIDV